MRRPGPGGVYVDRSVWKCAGRPMWPGTSGAQTDLMLLGYEFTRTMVADHQQDLRHDASRWRLARLAGRHRGRQRPSQRAPTVGL
jgi:hypothetical protein